MPVVKQIVFGNGLMTPTLMGEKTNTWRKYRTEAHDFKKDEVVTGRFMDGLDILLKITKDTEIKPFNEVTDEEAARDGRQDAEAAFNELAEYYPGLQPTDMLAKIYFRALRYKGTPAVQFNEHAQEEG